jgi:hypothetical protein
MRRDGVGAGSHPRLGEKAGRVVDMLAAVDPHAWSERFACTPRACLALLEGDDFAAAFVRGWALAAAHRATNHVDAGRLDWLRDLAHWWLTADPALRDAVPDSFFAAFGAAYREDREAIFSGLLDAFPAEWPLDPALVRLLHVCSDQGTGGWPPALSRRVLQRLGAALPLLPQAASPGHRLAAHDPRQPQALPAQLPDRDSRNPTRPQDTIFILISDLYEGGNNAEMLKRAASLVGSGVQVIALLALDDSGAPRMTATMRRSSRPWVSRASHVLQIFSRR